MTGSIILLAAGFLFLAGVAVGFRLQELAYERRERLVAGQRRDLAARARALDADAGGDRVVDDAGGAVAARRRAGSGWPPAADDRDEPFGRAS